MKLNSKTKLCFVISSLRAGGAERVISILANSFDEKKEFDVTIITINKAMPFYHISKNIQLISLDIKNDRAALLNSKNRIFKLSKALKETGPSLIISFNSTTSCEAIIAAKMNKLPIIISERANPKTSVHSIYWKILRRITFPFATHLVCQTEASKSFYSWVKNKSIIYNPVNIPTLKIIEKNDVVLGVGSLRRVKGFDLLIESFISVILSLNDKNWKLIILGEGKERMNLELQIKKSGFEDRIFLPGKVKDTSSYYSSSSIFALSSRSEGMPNVLLEALSFGLPSVAFDCENGPLEILEDGKIGLLAKNGNVDDLSSKLKELLINANLREKLREKALDKSNEFSNSAIVEKWRLLIDDITT